MENIKKWYEYLENCNVCPRKCNINRTKGERGYCNSGYNIKAALASIHNWEEPVISGTRGSGTVFFSGCNLRCVFCKNYDISSENKGKEITIERLAEIFIEQQQKNVHNINLVSPTHFIPQIREALIIAKNKGLKIPVVYNTNGYENVEMLKTLEGLIDVYLPDLKYFDKKYSLEFSSTSDYFEKTTEAILEMRRQQPKDVFNSEGIMEKGLIIRHLVLPGCKNDSFKIIDWVKNNLGTETYMSIMRQYTPMYKAKDIKQLNRKLTTFEYEKVTDYFIEKGMKNGFSQEKMSATSEYTPIFDLSGI